MQIHARFPGGNIQINRIDGDDVYLQQEIRDTTEWWFYWAFCLEGAAGRTLTFHFEDRDVIGYYGPCVSRDDVEYAWAGSDTRLDGHTFTYAVPQDAQRLYFRYSIPYQLARYNAWLGAQTAPLDVGVLCKSERGRDVPYFQYGDPNAGRSIIFTSRHHACESVATYVLQGAAEAVIAARDRLDALGCRLVVVPFVDLDGVEDGDQGKSRAPHDHNRDYTDAPIYAANRAMTALVKTLPPLGTIDFHCPWLYGNLNDYVSLVKASPEHYRVLDRFSVLLQAQTRQDPAPDTIPYDGLHDVRAGEKWLPAVQNPTTSSAFFYRNGATFAASLEIPYFGVELPFTAQNARRLGGHAALALLTLLEEEAR